MDKSKTKIRRPKTAGIARSPPASSMPAPHQPSSHQVHGYRKTKRLACKERPPVPAWMLDTPLYSKMPMVPAPAGKIMLYTTGLCEKLHVTPKGFDFDSSPQGMSMNYKSLHDPNLKGYYTSPRMYAHLMRSGYLTPCGMVKCGLKEFNDYHQYVKQVQLEELTQQRKRMMEKYLNRKKLTKDHKPARNERSVHIQQEPATSSKHHKRSSATISHSKSSAGQVRRGGVSKTLAKKGSIAKTKRPVGSVMQAHYEKRQKRKKTKRRGEMKTYERQSLLLSKRFDEEMRREQELERRKLVKMAERELKLQEQWDRREANREARLTMEAIQCKREEARASKVKIMRSQMVKAHQARQQAIFESIRDARARLVAQREAIIARRLEKRLERIKRKYNQRQRRQWAVFKHLIAEKGSGYSSGAELGMHTEEEMYGSEAITSSPERRRKHPSSEQGKPEVCITDKVLSVTSLDYRQSPVPTKLSTEELQGISKMRDVYLADGSSGEEDSKLQGADAVSPGVLAVSSDTGVALEVREVLGSVSREADLAALSENEDSSAPSSGSSSCTSVRDESFEGDAESVSSRNHLGKGDNKEDSEDEASETESEGPPTSAKLQDTSSEESDFWKSESEVSLCEGSLSSFAEEEKKVEDSKDDLLGGEDLIKEKADTGEVKDDNGKKEIKMLASTEKVDGDSVEKKEIKSRNLSNEKEKLREEKVDKEIEEKVQELDGTPLEENLGKERDSKLMLKEAQEVDEDKLQEAPKGISRSTIKVEDQCEEEHEIIDEIEQKIKEDMETEVEVEEETLETEREDDLGEEEVKDDTKHEEKVDTGKEIQNKTMEGSKVGKVEEKEEVKEEQEVVSKEEITKVIKEEIKETIKDAEERGEVKTKEKERGETEARVTEEEKQFIKQASDAVATVVEQSFSQLGIVSATDQKGVMEGRQQEVSQENGSEAGYEEETAMLDSDSVLLTSVLNILEKVGQEIHHHHHHEGHQHKHHRHDHYIHPQKKDEQHHSKDEDQDRESSEVLTASGSECESSSSTESDEGEEGDIIGVVENEIIAVEGSVTSLKGCLSGESVTGLTEVVKETEDHKLIFEGALVPLKHHSSTSTASSKVSINVTAAVLSSGSLKMDSSGRLKHDMASHSQTKPELKVSTTDISSGTAHPVEPDKVVMDESSHHHYSNIIPVYHDNLINIGEELIDANLSAISIKPDHHHKAPSAYSTGSRNSFRNIFRPDMTYCQGSAKCLKDTLVQELSHSRHSKHSKHSSAEMGKYYGILEVDQEDITAHHSEEELVTADDAEGVCYLPKLRKNKVSRQIEPTVPEQDEDLLAETQIAGIPKPGKEDECPVSKDSNEMNPMTTEMDVGEDTTLDSVGTDNEQVALESHDDEHTASAYSPNEVLVNATQDGENANASCDDSYAMVESALLKKSTSEVNTQLGQRDSDLSTAYGHEKVETKSGKAKAVSHQDSASKCDLHKAQAGIPAEGNKEVGPPTAVQTANMRESTTPTSQAHVEVHRGLCEVDVAGVALKESPESQENGIEDEKQEHEINPNNTCQSTTRHTDASQSGKFLDAYHPLGNPVQGTQSKGPTKFLTEVGNLKAMEITADTRNSSASISEAHTQDQGGLTSRSFKFNTGEGADEQTTGGSSDRGDNTGNKEQKLEADLDDTCQSGTRQMDIPQNTDCLSDNHTVGNPVCENYQNEIDEHETPPHIQNEGTPNTVHPNNRHAEICLHDHVHNGLVSVEDYTIDQSTQELLMSKGDASPEMQIEPMRSSYTPSATSLSSSIMLPISCGETPQSASSIFSDFDALNYPIDRCPRPLPNTVSDPAMDSSYASALQSSKEDGCTRPDTNDEMFDEQSSMLHQAENQQQLDPASSLGSASNIPSVDSGHAISTSKSNSSSKSGSRISAVVKKISSTFSIGRKHSNQVHPADEMEDDTKMKAKDEDA
ncbi:uncharacterized protein LOC110987053 isoform X2 [Acanthaster planci]|uniref:Uncharacterized protein LOC110987053 isoform X2 n=1 Tax=Acanthaster planci TaxID=133434 RepID=A0A8B7ZHN4_ACAPL|nr:uncharacterized protein LOC110987053 isoform X2 [Acanthaster planci]